MKTLMTVLLVLITTTSIFAQAGTSTLIKTEREDFNALIAEGLEGQKVLREELRAQAGLGDRERHWTTDLKETGRQLVGTLDSEQIVAPTTNYVRQKPPVVSASDISQKRMAEEMNNLDH